MSLRHGAWRWCAVPLLAAAVTAGWYAGRWMQDKDDGSLTETPASAPARLEEALLDAPPKVIAAVEPETPDEAETAAVAVQSASDDVETNDIRTDGHAAAAVGGAADGINDELLNLVTSESRLVTARLAKEIAALKSEVEDLNQRNRKLGEALAEAQAALDMNEERRARAEGPTPIPGTEPPPEARIADADAALGMVVLDRGVQHGMRYGLPLTVMRGRRKIGRIRVVDVRERIAGAVVEETARGEVPQTGDRAVLMRPDGT